MVRARLNFLCISPCFPFQIIVPKRKRIYFPQKVPNDGASTIMLALFFCGHSNARPEKMIWERPSLFDGVGKLFDDGGNHYFSMFSFFVWQLCQRINRFFDVGVLLQIIDNIERFFANIVRLVPSSYLAQQLLLEESLPIKKSMLTLYKLLSFCRDCTSGSKSPFSHLLICERDIFKYCANCSCVQCCCLRKYFSLSPKSIIIHHAIRKSINNLKIEKRGGDLCSVYNRFPICSDKEQNHSLPQGSTSFSFTSYMV